MTKKSGSGMKAAKAAQDAVVKGADKFREKVAQSADDAREQARRNALKIVEGMMQLQQKTFDGAFKLLSQMQDHTEKTVKDFVSDSQWLPKEGKAVVNEWIKTVHSGRVRFQETVDKSFDLVMAYLKRVQEVPETVKPAAAKVNSEENRPGKKQGAAEKARRKPPARKKPTAP